MLCFLKTTISTIGPAMKSVYSREICMGSLYYKFDVLSSSYLSPQHSVFEYSKSRVYVRFQMCICFLQRYLLPSKAAECTNSNVLRLFSTKYIYHIESKGLRQAFAFNLTREIPQVKPQPIKGASLSH